MNYLAHAQLSFSRPGILVGNMISDFVKGRKQYDFPPAIQAGIRLHRAIDEFTDMHPLTKELKSFFRPAYRLYAGAFGDVVYDHFLATDPAEFPAPADLRRFTISTYGVLEAHYELLPPAFQMILPYMKEQDWLYNYQYPWGIEKSFGGLVRRASYLTESDTAFSLFGSHYEAMRSCYAGFYPALKRFTVHQLEQLPND